MHLVVVYSIKCSGFTTWNIFHIPFRLIAYMESKKKWPCQAWYHFWLKVTNLATQCFCVVLDRARPCSISIIDGALWRYGRYGNMLGVFNEDSPEILRTTWRAMNNCADITFVVDAILSISREQESGNYGLISQEDNPSRPQFVSPEKGKHHLRRNNK